MSLKITQAKPNPIGKDRYGHVVPNPQLVGEWIDIKNTSSSQYNLSGDKLQHVEHPSNTWDNAYIFPNGFVLRPYETVRVHSGDPVNITSLLPIDRGGAQHHVFTNDYYVWNNNGDTARIVDGYHGREVDRVSYLYAPEGRILIRIGDKLM